MVIIGPNGPITIGSAAAIGFALGGYMASSSGTPPTKSRSNVPGGIVARAAQIVIVLTIQGLILFLVAGRLEWTWAWVFLGIYLVSISINSAFMIRGSPETIAERGRPKEMRNWDKLVGGSWGLAQFVVLPLVAGLDVRLGWTREISAPWHLGGALVFAGGLALSG